MVRSSAETEGSDRYITVMTHAFNAEENVADILRGFLKRTGLKQVGLAKLCGYASQSSVSRFFQSEQMEGQYIQADVVADHFIKGLVGEGTPPITAEEVWRLAKPSSRPTSWPQETDRPDTDVTLQRAYNAALQALDKFAEGDLLHASPHDRHLMAVYVAQQITSQNPVDPDNNELIRILQTSRKLKA